MKLLKRMNLIPRSFPTQGSSLVFLVIMLKKLSMGDREVKGWVRDLGLGLIPPVVGSAIVPAASASGAMRLDVMLRSHQPRGSVRSAGLKNYMIPARLSLELSVALRAYEAVFCVIMLGDCQHDTLESSSEHKPSSSTFRS